MDCCFEQTLVGVWRQAPDKGAGESLDKH